LSGGGETDTSKEGQTRHIAFVTLPEAKEMIRGRSR